VQRLRWLEHPGAVEVLHHAYEAFRPYLEADPASCAALLQAIGQHGAESSVAILGEAEPGGVDAAVVRARLLGLARIRSARALRALFGMLERLERLDPALRAERMPDFRLAALRITGADEGESVEAWRSWWSRHAEDPIPEPPPALPSVLQDRWDAYWAGP
jgi:hypothetical protein